MIWFDIFTDQTLYNNLTTVRWFMTSDLNWLRFLHNDIWMVVGYSRPHKIVKRHLTPKEQERLFNILAHNGLTIHMFNTAFGFGIGISAYSDTPADHLISISNAHIGETCGFECGWNLFSPIALSAENQKRHAYLFGETLPTEKSYYSY